MKTYKLSNNGSQDNITCLLCDRTSYHPKDVSNRFCGHCKIFHDNIADTIRRSRDEDPHVAEGFTKILTVEISKLPTDSQEGARRLLGNLPQPQTAWDRLLNPFV